MADSKLSALTETVAIDGTELVYVVEDPSGTPVSRRVTVANLLASLALELPVSILSFGAVGNGTTDNRAAIQAAVDYAAAQGLSTVSIPDTLLGFGVSLAAHPVVGDPYYCAITVPNGVRLECKGFLKLLANQGVSGKSNAVVMNRQISVGGDENLSFDGLVIDGNNLNQTVPCSGAVVLRARGVKYTRCRVRNMFGNATSGLGESVHFSASLSTDVSWLDCVAECTGGSSASGFSANSSTNVRWIGCTARGMTVANGFTHNACRNVTYVGCRSYLNARTGFNSEVSQDVVYNSCIAGSESSTAATYPYASGTSLGNTDHGFTINGSTNVGLIGCISRKNSQGANWSNAAFGYIVGGEYTDNAYGLAFSDTTATLVRISGNPKVSGNATKDLAVPSPLTGNYHPPGNVGAPSVPSSTVALTNPYPYAAGVYVLGGTVTAIAVAGIATGLTSGLVHVPAGATIMLTYSSAPTWTWFID